MSNKILDSVEQEIIKNMCEYDMNMSQVARIMHCHRNTLMYNLEKIKRKTGLDPVRFNDLVKLRDGINMSDIRMKELYENNIDFQNYVGKYCRAYHITVAAALEHDLVKRVGEYYRKIEEAKIHE